MSAPGRTPTVGVFAVDDRSVQLTWRHLDPGPLELRIETIGSITSTGAYVADPDPHHGPSEGAAAPEPWRSPGPGHLVLDGDATSSPGSVVIDGLSPGTLFVVRATGRAVGRDQQVAVRTLPALPGEELCRVATLSDLHLGCDRFGHRGTIRERPVPEVLHPVRCSRAALDEAVGWGAERILVKGDLTNFGAPAQWREYAALVAASPVPVDAIPGNHDNAHPMSRAHIPADAAAEAFGLTIADPILVRDLPGLRVVLLDTTRPGRHGGTLGHGRAAVLDAVAEADPAGGVLIAVHHQLQPHRLPEGWPTGIGRDESRRFLADVGALHPHVLVTSGHTHRHRRWAHAGVTVTQVGATKDYPGTWAGYTVHEGGLRQLVRRVGRPDCLRWTDHTRRAAGGMWGHIAPGRLDARCFNLAWTVPIS